MSDSEIRALMDDVAKYHEEVTAALVALDSRVRSLERRLNALIVIVIVAMFALVAFLAGLLL